MGWLVEPLSAVMLIENRMNSGDSIIKANPEPRLVGKARCRD